MITVTVIIFLRVNTVIYLAQMVLTGKSFLLTVGLSCLRSIGLVFFTYGLVYFAHGGN